MDKYDTSTGQAEPPSDVEVDGGGGVLLALHLFAPFLSTGQW